MINRSLLQRRGILHNCAPFSINPRWLIILLFLCVAASSVKAQEAVNKQGEKISLSKKETMLLKLLIENKNEVVPREKILQSVWGYNVYPTTRTIDNFILSFRKYFEDDSRNPKFFHSVRGVGYKYAE